MSVTHMMIYKRADNCRDRVDMTHSFRVCRPARRPSRPGAAWWDMTLRSRGGHRSPGLSKWVGPMASTRSALERATCGSRSTLAADTSGNLASVFPPFFKQVAWASESRNRALLYHKTTSYQATTSGTAKKAGLAAAYSVVSLRLTLNANPFVTTESGSYCLAGREDTKSTATAVERVVFFKPTRPSW